jgi:hypothetical protein
MWQSHGSFKYLDQADLHHDDQEAGIILYISQDTTVISISQPSKHISSGYHHQHRVQAPASSPFHGQILRAAADRWRPKIMR